MRLISMTKTELKKVYDSNRNLYELICSSGKELIEGVLRAQKIDLLHVSSRVKSFESFYEKISRKKYKNPYIEIEDICGLRIVCFYANDLGKIDQIIHQTFLMSDFVDKAESIDPDRFGYRANHYIVRLPESKETSKLSKFKIEIQARTILMHAWAHIQGKLEYKKAEHTPKEFKRKLYQLSAILELADGQFQSLKKEKDALRESLVAGDFHFSDSTELNIDTFMAFMDAYLSDRKKSYRYSKLLMKTLLEHKVGFKQLIKSYQQSYEAMIKFEKEMDLKLTQDEAMKVMLYITDRIIVPFLEEDQLVADYKDSLTT